MPNRPKRFWILITILILAIYIAVVLLGLTESTRRSLLLRDGTGAADRVFISMVVTNASPATHSIGNLWVRGLHWILIDGDLDRFRRGFLFARRIVRVGHPHRDEQSLTVSESIPRDRKPAIVKSDKQVQLNKAWYKTELR